METLWQDLRYTTRTLAKHPAFVLAGVLVLGLAIGVNTAIFSVINAILFRPLPVRAPGELRYLYGTVQGIPNISAQMQYRHFLVVRERRDAFSDVLYKNPGFGNNWLAVELIGKRSNRSAIGARLRAEVVRPDGSVRSVYLHVNSGGSFGANPLRQTIGLGENGTVRKLEVFWPTTNETTAT